nr:hypothetical protein [Cytophagales bacterium]
MKGITDKMCLEVGILFALLMVLGHFYFEVEKLTFIAGISLFICLVWPRFWAPLAFIWFSFGEILGSIFSFVLLAVLFLFLVTPIGVFRRMLGSDSLKLKAFKSQADSHFIQVDKEVGPRDLIHQF